MLAASDPSHAGGAFVGSVSQLLGSADVTLAMGNHDVLDVKVLVPSELADDMLLGSDTLRRYGMVLDMEKEELRWDNKIIPVSMESHTLQVGDPASPPVPVPPALKTVRVCRTTQVAHNALSHIQVLIPEPDGTIVMIEAIKNQKHEEREVVIPVTLCTVRNGMAKTPVYNVGTKKVKLKHPTPLGIYSIVNDTATIAEVPKGDLQQQKALIAELSAAPEVDLPEGAAVVAASIDNESLTDAQRRLLFRLLYKHKNLFDGTLGNCQLGNHAIETGDAKPIHLPRRRYSQVEEQIIEKEIKEMLEKGVIEPACGPWAAAIVLVKKKDDKWRFVSITGLLIR